MNAPRVFIPQIVHRYDHLKHDMVPAFDFSAAAMFGQLTPILSAGEDTAYLCLITPQICAALADFKEGDYFLAVGDPAVIAICSGVILRQVNKMNLLKWDRKTQVYFNMEIAPEWPTIS